MHINVVNLDETETPLLSPEEQLQQKIRFRTIRLDDCHHYASLLSRGDSDANHVTVQYLLLQAVELLEVKPRESDHLGTEGSLPRESGRALLRAPNDRRFRAAGREFPPTLPEKRPIPRRPFREFHPDTRAKCARFLPHGGGADNRGTAIAGITVLPAGVDAVPAVTFVVAAGATSGCHREAATTVSPLLRKSGEFLPARIPAMIILLSRGTSTRCCAMTPVRTFPWGRFCCTRRFGRRCK